MSAPTVAARLAPRFIVLGADAAFGRDARAAAAPGWTVTLCTDWDGFANFAEVLMHRFVLADLAPGTGCDPVECIRALRQDLQLTLPVFCFGGDRLVRDAARSVGADRYFERAELPARVAEYCAQYAWGR